MNNIRLSLAAAACGFLLSAAPAAFAGTNEYQVTGSVTAVTDTSVTVLKGAKESFEMARTADTPGLAGVKVGDKVTAKYTLTATSVMAKPDKAPKAPKTAASPAKPAAEASPAK